MNTKKVITVITMLGVIIGGWFMVRNNPAVIVSAAGDLDINWGVPAGDPIFVVNNMLPGDTESRTVIITNNAAFARPVAVRGVKTSESLNFSTILDFVISENGTDIYGGTSPTGPKTLADFFTETIDPLTIPLSTISPGITKTYIFEAHFQESAGNEFQNAEVIFDLIIGIDSDIPAECQFIEFSNPPIFGTDGDDNIRGTLGNDLVYALEGDDVVKTFGGDDCIIGGPGDDDLRGETNNDVIFGNEGNDLVIGANGNDLLFGNDGNDTIRGENGTDEIYGGIGDDYITGGNNADQIYGELGNDTIYGENGNDHVRGGAGNDFLDGGNGTDILEGEADNDILHGKSGNDTLLGGTQTDSANGWSGTDTCDAETETNCEI